MEKTRKWRSALIFGFVGLLLCGVGDWLIGYEPRGGEALMFGITNTRITEVPTWFYMLSMLLGVLSAFACQRYAPVMLEILDGRGVDRGDRAYRAFRFGLSSAPLMFISFHVVCCVCLVFSQAALKEGVAAEGFARSFAVPAMAILLFFVVWCFIVDIPCTVAYMALVWKGRLGLPRTAVVLCPLGMSLVGKLVAAILFAVGLDRYAFLTACGESWGWAFMCLAFLKAISSEKMRVE